MIIDDIPQVVYAPLKVFKKIIENPKYLGALIILLLFVGIQVGYEYAQFSKIYTENTSPTVNLLSNYTNATLWTNSSSIALSNNYDDFFNYSVYVAALGTTTANPQGFYSLFGNSSLEIDAVNTNSVSATLNNTFNVDCGTSGFQNLSITIKMVQPQIAPQSAALTLYSFNDSNFYTYELTSSLSNATAIGLWNNLTIPLGPVASGWTRSGAPNWGNVTALKLDFTYPTNSNITIHIGALFFRGQYETPIQYNNYGLLLQFLQVFSLQFILGWLLIAGLIYLMFKALKTNATWKPLFIALGFALFVMVIRALVNLVAALTLPNLYYPFDLSLGLRSDTYGAWYYPQGVAGTLSVQSQAILNSITAATAAFRFVTSAIFVVAYVWLGVLCTIIIGTLKPEFSMMKRLAISAVSIVATILLLLLLIGIA
ncbi:MAG: hypothetical protein ABSA75_00120 [Candidatus Bathyarchaeia archaeon]